MYKTLNSLTWQELFEKETRDYFKKISQGLDVLFLSAPLFYILPEKLQYCNIIVYFIFFILFLDYFAEL